MAELFASDSDPFSVSGLPPVMVRAPPLATLTAPLMAPVPPSSAPELTETGPVPVPEPTVLDTSSVPPVMLVPPV